MKTELPPFDPSIPLRPGLSRWIVEHDTPMGPSFKHPFWYQVPYSPHFNALINQGTLHKWDLIKKRRHEENWSGIIWLMERPYRPPVLYHVRDRMDGPAFWDLFRSVWLDAEFTWQWLLMFQHMLTWTHVPHRHHIMEPEERRALFDMPNQFKVYRGVRDIGHDGSQGPDGFSWTLDRTLAEWFAQRLTCETDDPHIVEGWVKRDDVVGYLTGREKQEILVPIGTVDITGWEQLHG